MKQNYEKQRISLRYWLLGKGYVKAAEAMTFAETYHNGKRKDGQHEFSHQVAQAHLARTLEPFFQFPEEVFIVIFLHDICEDKGISYEEILRRFGMKVQAAVKLMTKVYQGVKVPNDIYYDDISMCEIASICKGLDRLHNILSMLGGFKPEKRMEYIAETKEYSLPMLKRARLMFPHQEPAYEMIKFIIESHIMLYEALNEKHLELSK